jgi:dolichol-phosphate mannosyltransferase
MMSVVIPAYNEESDIGQTVTEMAAVFDKNQLDYEILVVNDGSTDSTAARLAELQQRIPRLRFVTNPGPHGYGCAVQYGLQHYGGEAVVIAMADRTEYPEDIVLFYRKLLEGYDCVFGSRFGASGLVEGYPPFKLFVNRVGNTLLRMLTGGRFDDLTNGFKMYRRWVIEEISPLRGAQFNICVEMAIKALRTPAKIAVVPNRWINRSVSESKFRLFTQVRLYLLTILYCLIEPVITKPSRPAKQPRGNSAVGTLEPRT